MSASATKVTIKSCEINGRQVVWHLRLRDKSFQNGLWRLKCQVIYFEIDITHFVLRVKDSQFDPKEAQEGWRLED